MFLHTRNEQSGKEIKKTIQFISVTKIIAYLEINLTKDVQDFYVEKYKSLLK